MESTSPKKIFKFHTSRLKYLLPYSLIILLFALGIFFLFTHRSLSSALIVWAAGLMLIGVMEIVIRKNRLILEDSQMVYNEGILSRKSNITHYAAVVDILTTQTFIQRIFGIGNIHIKTTASTGVRAMLLESFPKLYIIETFVKNKVHLYKGGKK